MLRLSLKRVLLLVRFDDENDVSLLKVEPLNLSFYMFSFWRREKTRQKEENASVVWALTRALPCASNNNALVVSVFFDGGEKERKKDQSGGNFLNTSRATTTKKRERVSEERRLRHYRLRHAKAKKRRRKMPSWTTKRGKKWTNPCRGRSEIESVIRGRERTIRCDRFAPPGSTISSAKGIVKSASPRIYFRR